MMMDDGDDVVWLHLQGEWVKESDMVTFLRSRL